MNYKMSFDLRGALVSMICFTLLCWYLQFLWRRRQLYILSWNAPGPLAFPFLGNIYLFRGGQSALAGLIDRLAETYPEFCRIWIGPYLLYGMAKPEHIEPILCTQMEKSDWVYDIIARDLAGYGLLFSSADKWKPHRKIIRQSFGQNTLDSFMEKFNVKAEILRDQLKEHTGEVDLDLLGTYFKFSVDTICETLMGVEMNTQTIGSGFDKSFSSIMEIMTKKMYSVWYHIDIIWKFSPLGREFNTLVKIWRGTDVMTTLCDKINNHRKNPGDADETQTTQDHRRRKLPFLDWILETSDFTKTELVDEITTFIGAGIDTIATAMACSIMSMGMYQDIQEKVYQEVLDICGPNRRILPSDINKLKYTERVLKETLRLFPPAPFMLRYIDTEVNLGDYTLPEGSSAIFYIRAIHLNSKHWPNPYRFDPDRFLPENVSKRHPCAYIPFSYGPRNCIGGRFAMMVLLTALAILIRKFKFFTAYKTVEEIELLPNMVLKLKDGEKVRLELR